MYKVLIVDDEQLERDALKAIINKGIDSIIEIQDAANGREAIVKSRTYIPDIIFLDIKMPGINGIEAAKTIRALNPAVSIVFLTAFNQFEYAHEAIQIGVDDFIIKPSSEKRVLEVMIKLINKISGMRSELNQREDNKLKLSRVTGYLESEFIYNLSVRGITEEKFENYLSILDINFSHARTGIIKLLYDTYPIHIDTNYQRQVLKKRCVHIVKSNLVEKGIFTFFNMDLSNIFFLLCADNRENHYLDNLNLLTCISEIVNLIKRTLSIDAVIGIGSQFSNPEKALSSFSIAKNNLGLLLTNENQQRSASEEALNVVFPINLEMEMEQAIISGNREAVMEVFQKISAWLSSSLLDFNEKKRTLTELVTILKHAAAYQSPNGSFSINDNEIKDAFELAGLLSAVQMFINDLLEQILSIHENESSPAIHKAAKFIDENYYKDITLEETAFQCRLSSFYFSKQFKKQKKITFIDYLTNRRL
nr:response regulator [Spirochaetota bacterium]